MSPSTILPAAFALAASTALATSGCQNSPPEPSPEPERRATPQQADIAHPGGRPGAPSDNNNLDGTKAQRAAGGDDKKSPTPEPPRAPVRRKVAAQPTASVTPSPDDPLQGKFTLDDATKGLPPGKQILATIETSMGKLECKLFDDKAPITVANFVGLARGVRPWKTPDGTWATKKPAYDGTVFHRVIKGFMIQGGDAKKNGSGEAGYVIPNEVWEDGSHDRAGLLCMANRGKNTNSAQFFITDDAAYHLDNGYTIFGECGPVNLVHKIAAIEVRGDRPASPPDITKVTITRK